MKRKTFLVVSSLCALVAWACGSSDGSNFVDLSKLDAGGDSGNTNVVPIGGGDGAPPIDQTDSSPPAQGSCTRGADGGSGCQYDTYCDPVTNTCLPYGAGQNNAECHQVAIPGNFAPKTKCEFPLDGDAGADFPEHVDVQTTPLVARFGKDAVPSIVAPFTKPVGPLDGQYTEHLGVLRILKGTDCTQQAVLGGTDLDSDGDIDWVRSSAAPAIGDLDGDGVPEIVAFMTSATKVSETMMAFTLKSGTWQPLWAKKKATLANGTTIFEASGANFTPPITATPGTNFGKGNWASPSIHDLDDDGVPEIIREGWVFDGKTGVLRANPPANYVTYRQGIHPVLANLDDDAKIEMTNGARVWEFDPTTGWKEETYYDQTTTSKPGWAAVADFDPAPPAVPTPEIAVASTSNLTIFTTAHAVFKGMNLAVPGGGGGPPTIADFDGDGLPEVGIAGQAFYTVFDPDCQGTPRTGGKCDDRTHCDHVPGGACPDKILWSRATQDNSSNVTGSSVFDFEADGKAEVVYADECFTRVYSGSDGTVLFSRYRSSCTWNENPVVADVDGDFRAELVVGSNTACGEIGVGQICRETTDPSAQGHGQLEPGTDIDSQFIGLRCLKGTDCVSGTCDNGFCRCATSAECCADKDVAKCETFGTKCAAPPAGTPGTGKTCRANHPKAVQGIRVYEDANDQWVRSRSIWNQHAYAVTNVNEDGTIPKTSSWQKNWTQSGLDNFRQNVPGTANAFDIGDLTSQSTAAFQCNGSTAVLATPVCNRGTAPIGAGVSVGFYAGTTKACGAKTKDVLQPGACESVSCEWTSPPLNTPGVDVDVVPNDDGQIAQCDPNNDKGLVKAVFCTGVK